MISVVCDGITRPCKRLWGRFLLLYLVLGICLAWPIFRAPSISAELELCQATLAEALQGSSGLQTMVKPQVREPVTDVPLTGADQECDARLHQAERRLQKLLDSQKESRGEDDVKQGSSFAAMLSARREVKEAIQASRTAYMRSAFRNDVLALQATLNKFNTTLAAEWEVALVEQTQRGIFMLAGPRDGSVYLINAFATLWVIRHHFKSKLPVVIM